MKMNNISIQELKHYSKKDLLKLLKDDEKAFNKLLNHQLIQKDKDSYQLNYVGVIIIDNLVINAYPNTSQMKIRYLLNKFLK